FWLAVRKRFVGGPLLTFQSSLGLMGSMFLLGQALVLVFVDPSAPLPEFIFRVNDFAGWLALILAATAAIWLVRKEWPTQTIHVLGLVGVLFGILFAAL